MQVFHFQLLLCIQGCPVRDQLPPCFDQASGGRGALGTGGAELNCCSALQFLHPAVGRRARHFSLSFSQDERAPFVASFTCSLSFRWPAITSGQISVHTTKTSPLPHTGHEICHRWSWPISILWLHRRTWAQSDSPNSTRSPDRESYQKTCNYHQGSSEK